LLTFTFYFYKKRRELNDKLKKFAQFMSVSDYETLLENLRKQRQLYARIEKLRHYRSELGIRALGEIDEYVRAKQERKLTKPKRYSYLLGLSKRVTRGGSRASSPNKSFGDFNFNYLPERRPYVRKNSLAMFSSPAAAASAGESLLNGHATTASNGNGHALVKRRGRKPKNAPPVQPATATTSLNFDADIYDDEESNTGQAVEYDGEEDGDEEEDGENEQEGEDEEEAGSEDMEGIENSEPEDDDDEGDEDEDGEEEEDDGEEVDDEDADELEDGEEGEEQDEEVDDSATTTSSSGSAVYELNEDNVVCRLRRLTSRSSSVNNISALNVSPKSSMLINGRVGKLGITSRSPKPKKTKAVVTAAAALIKKLKRPLKNNSQLVNATGRRSTALTAGRKRKRVKLSNSRNDGRTERVCSMPGYNLLSENEKKVFITRTLR
jgi:hypothetical protein